jgi:hypothetical protein
VTRIDGFAMNLMPEGLTVSAMIAAHARLDDAHAVVTLASRKNLQKDVAGMIVARLKSSPTALRRFINLRSGLSPVGRHLRCAIGSAQMPFYRFTH